MNKHSTIELGHDFEAGVGIEIVPVGDADLDLLQHVLDRSDAIDPYKKSAAYFAMTGRNGLWMIRDAKAALLVCQHPNRSDTMLVFPPIGNAGNGLIGQAVSAIEAIGAKAKFARIENDQEPDNVLMPTIGTTKVEEKELDWAYPVHTLGTSKVADHKGNLFQQFRTKLNKLDRSRITVEDLQPHQHSEAVAKILKGWNGPEPEKLAPYQRLLDLFGTLPLRGRLAFQYGEPVGFSIWEETSQAHGLANAYAHIGLHEVPGMSRFVILDMCETLLARGFDRVCIGGSETEGLDQFKRQLRPVESLDLASYDISLKNNPSCGKTVRLSQQHEPNRPRYASRTF